MIRYLKSSLIFFLVGSALTYSASEGAPKIIDLGVGGISSDIQGAQYLSRIRGSSQDLLQTQALDFESEVIRDLEQRHLQLLLNEKGATK